MAIFVALIFQVLFVFFAMVVNIGLIVHDKINLQNAVDLGAYYAAQRQAEMFNEIAHINYQLRQDYKLLAWRSRVLGAIGRKSHPQRYQGPVQDIMWKDPEDPDPKNSEFPGICVMHNYWEESRSRSAVENLCKNRPNYSIPEIPAVKVVPLTLPFNNIIKAIVEGYREEYKGVCNAAGPLNWVFAAQLLYAFRESGAVRKGMARALAINSSDTLESGAFRDLEVQSVRAGVETTIRKNLTAANRDSLEPVTMINGLNYGPCAQNVNGYPYWLREISIDPVMIYLNMFESSGCKSQLMPLMYIPGTVGPDGKMVAGRFDVIKNFDPSGDLRTVATQEPNIGDLRHSSRGFEKNPWCMAYVGVKARTAPRKPFAPFGQPISLEARAFAQPFGGRIGPWDKGGWAPGGQFSSGLPTDALAVPRTIPGVGLDRNDNPLFVPNYSRFPGDTLGLRSSLAMASTRNVLFTSIANGQVLALGHYSHLPQIATQGDVLAWNQNLNSAPFERLAEASAITPDLFDATYYSIEPDYYGNYFARNTRMDRFIGIPEISDLGSRKLDPRLQAYGVRDQIKQAFGLQALDPDVYWAIRSPAHLLTGWNQQGAVDYSFPDEFGKCAMAPEQRDPATVGDCIAGGRVGYSVRFVHKDFLLFPKHQLGGSDQALGPILNPPPVDF